ncbi:hypothetical protein [Caballeronia zhejiangensis]|uniref:Uncharacterized protein n=1 Tax=Caballeronia zhejiangensis TaxID=871203 RepID=A0A656Q9P0_9BURK|nr:hypothetical protein [Caballeronia zhejiangensis]KDR25993.1 hypothetical protein BG60_26355 [Caballeronia zhejiangensis]
MAKKINIINASVKAQTLFAQKVYHGRRIVDLHVAEGKALDVAIRLFSEELEADNFDEASVELIARTIRAQIDLANRSGAR